MTTGRGEGGTPARTFSMLFESVSKEIFGMPTATIGNVLVEVRKQQSMAGETINAAELLGRLSEVSRKLGDRVQVKAMVVGE